MAKMVNFVLFTIKKSMVLSTLAITNYTEYRADKIFITLTQKV